MEKYSKKVDSDVKIMRHISSYTKFNDKKKLLNRNESFDNFRYNYLNLRKTIGEFKKYEQSIGCGTTLSRPIYM